MRQAGQGRERLGGAQRDGAAAHGVARRCPPAEIVQFMPVWWRVSPPSRAFPARRMAPRGAEQQRALRTGRLPLVNYPCPAGAPRAGPLMMYILSHDPVLRDGRPFVIDDLLNHLS